MKRKLSIVLIILIIFLPLAESGRENLKNVPEKYEAEINEVLEGYPELKNTTIEFFEGPSSYTAQALPKPQSFVLEKEEREYAIILNNRSRKNNGIPVQKLNKNQTIGLLAHELGHIVDYQEQPGLILFLRTISYIGPKSREVLEKKVDKIAIKHGFGPQLVDFSKVAFYGNISPKSYKKKKRDSYYSPEKLSEMTDKYGPKKKSV